MSSTLATDVGGGARRLWRRYKWAIGVVGAFAVAAILCAAAILLATSPVVFTDGRVQTIRSAEICAVDGLRDALPGADCAWKAVQLPKMGGNHSKRPERDSWFRVRFDLREQPRESVALVLTSFIRAGRVYVNGAMVSTIGPVDDPMPYYWNRAVLVEIPPSMLKQGINELDIQQRTHSFEGALLGPVRLGPPGLMRRFVDFRQLWQNDAVLAMSAMTVAFGLLMIGIWVLRRTESAYLWFGLSCLAWTIVSMDFVVRYPVLPGKLWDFVSTAMQGLRGVVICVFVLRYCAIKAPRLEAVMWLYFAAGVVALSAVGVGSWTDLWYVTLSIASLPFAYLLVREGLRRSVLEGSLLCIAAVTQAMLSAYDIALFSGVYNGERIYLAHYSVPLYLVVIGMFMIRRFVRSLRAFEALNADLERRIAEKSAELEGFYESMAEVRRAETLAAERNRIMSEMHDGIGSQLTTALAMVRKLDRSQDPAVAGRDGPIARVLRESIDDLQLIVDSLEPVEHDLLTVLGTLRYRLEDRLSEAGIELQWRVVDLPPLPVLTPHSVLSVLRVVQEAFANALKHSGAKRIEVVTGLLGEPGEGEMAFVCVIDDGRGLGATVDGGKGLKNMRARAKSLDGTLSIKSDPGRTEVLLLFPTLRKVAA